MMNIPTLSYRERAAVDAHYRAMSVGGVAYDAWLAALRAYGDDSPTARQRLNQIIATYH